MEMETMSQMKDVMKLDEIPLKSLNGASRQSDIEANLTKSGSLVSLRNPLSTNCARHGYENDFLPSEILMNLTSQFETIEDLGPKGKTHMNRGKGFSKMHSKRPPDNVWNYSKTRERFKHLTEQPPCTCGAGRDISFLYDAVSSKKSSIGSPLKSSVTYTSGAKENNNEKEMPVMQSQDKSEVDQQHEMGASRSLRMVESNIQESLLPTEFHIVKNPGVLGLEIHDEKFTTTMDSHGKHLTLFPSMKPSGRKEAILLKKTMKDLLSRVGVYEVKEDIDQPTQIHALLDLVKQEQNIYNVVFNEIIRQVTVDCVERGELLADLRKRYAKLLDKIPRHVKSLHEEVLAQRALDRRLTEELTRFRTSITLLTRELHSVQEHDREVTKRAAETQEELNEALRESEKNASLLAEYHELYELQRKRLEFQISKLIEERDLWAGASYTLSVKVTRKNNLRTARRLHLHEKAWFKLASHFAIVLSDIDSINLQQLTSSIQKWQDTTERLNDKLLGYEKETCRKLLNIQSQIRQWGRKFSRYVSPDDATVQLPEQSTIAKLHNDMKNWEEVFNLEVERFSGEILLACEDNLVKMNTTVDNWNEVALTIFRQHPSVNNNERRLEHNLMISLNNEIDKLHKNFKARMTGENGLAKGIIHLINVWDSLLHRLNAYSLGSEAILDPEWIRIADFLQHDWDEVLSELIRTLNREIRSDDIAELSTESIQAHNVQSLGKAVQQWLTQTSNSIENADASMLDQASNNHSNMVRWMVAVLLRLAPDLDIDPFDDNEENRNSGIGAAIISDSMTSEIQDRARLQFRHLRKLTNTLYHCCKGVVSDDVSGRNGDEGEVVGIDKQDLNKIRAECNGWISTAILLVEELSGEIIKELDSDDENENGDGGKTLAEGSLDKDERQVISKGSEREAPINAPNLEGSRNSISPPMIKNDAKKDMVGNRESIGDKDSGKSREAEDSIDPIQMHVLGRDENVELKTLDTASIAKEGYVHHASDLLKNEESTIEALVTIEKLQERLVETEERAQTMEERAITAETSLKEALERIRALERSIRRASQDSGNQRRYSESGSLSGVIDDRPSSQTSPKH